MKILPSYNVQIWCGLREGYTDIVHDYDEVNDVIDKWIKSNPDCVTITPTQFVYKDGWENGVIIGWIQYPRFPRSKEDIKGRAVKLGYLLMETFKQNRITITTPDESIMLENGS